MVQPLLLLQLLFLGLLWLLLGVVCVRAVLLAQRDDVPQAGPVGLPVLDAAEEIGVGACAPAELCAAAAAAGRR